MEAGRVKLTLDSNLLVYAAQRGDRRQPRAAEIVERASAADCVQTLQSLSECFTVLWRKRGFPVETARQIVEGYRATFPAIVAARIDDLGAAIQASGEHRLQFWDAMLWATARRAGCRLIVTEDMQDGRELDGVLFVNPFAATNSRLIDLALPATNGTMP